jgi:hypothetical protein
MPQKESEEETAMPKPQHYDFVRYLAAKRAIDDRALNKRCWDKLHARVEPESSGNLFEVLEVGAGIGTMLMRMVEWGIRTDLSYIGVDADRSLVAQSESLLIDWAEGKGWKVVLDGEKGVEISAGDQKIWARLECTDVFAFAAKSARQWDLLLAHSFLDLVNLSDSLMALKPLVRKQGLLYFTLVFDGMTILLPNIEPEFDEFVIDCYHRSMDSLGEAEPQTRRSQTGRALLEQLVKGGGNIFCAGSSDWVIHPPYQADDAYFLHHIIHFMQDALEGCADLDPDRLSHWLEARHKQIQAGQLIYIAHQIDVLAQP